MTLLVHALSTEFDFVFCDAAGNVFYCYDWNGTKWLFYWHKDHWVSLREINIHDAFPMNLPFEEQERFINLHAKWEALQTDILKDEIRSVVNAKN